MTDIDERALANVRGGTSPHHPVFTRFRGYVGPRPQGIDIDFVGFRSRAEWDAAPVRPALDMSWPPPPSLSDEYFEWIDLLEAVEQAQDRFVMVEVGAGYGRWAVRGALAARQKGLPADLVLVEAEPQHAAYAREALQLNGVEGRVIEAAVAYSQEPVAFAVGASQHDAQSWYGQSVLTGPGDATGRTYFGRPVYQGELFEQIFVRPVTLEQACEGLGVVDLLDSDLQGAELDMVANEIGFMSRRVKRVHIGTHSTEIEDGIRRIFQRAGWRCVWDFSLLREQETPYGTCEFGDGVQGWINPALVGA